MEVLSFPWKRTYRTDADLRYAFEQLKAYRPCMVSVTWRNPYIDGINLTYGGKPYIIKHNEREYTLFDWIADYFVENHRLDIQGVLASWQECKIQCLEEWFNKNHDQSIVEELACILTIIPKDDDPTKSAIVATGNISNELHRLRGFLQKKFREPSLFKPTVLTTFIDWFGATAILDTNAGYGERLVAALSRNVAKYFGAEEDTKLVAHHRHIIDTLAPGRARVYTVPKDFMKAHIRGYFDLAFVCFTDRSKCQAKYKREIGYKRGVLRKAWTYLQPGGHMILYHSRDIDKLMNIIRENLPGIEYLGVIASVETNNMGNNIPQPCWIFRKYLVYYS